MNEVIKFLTDNHVFYLTTVDGDVPKVRPFGFVMEYDGKMCFCTNNRKNVYRQMKANPNIEICAVSPTDGWLRLSGRAVFITTRDAKLAALKAMPSLERMYSADDEIFEVFALEDAQAAIYGATGASRTIAL